MLASFPKSWSPFLVGAAMLITLPSWAQESAPAEDAQQEALTPEQEQAARRAALEELGFKPGPMKAKVGPQADMEVPEGFLYTDASGSKTFLEATRNIPSGREVATLFHEKDGFFIIFEFNPVGYVKDDDKDELDADAMLESLREGQREANKILERRGDSTLTVAGWHTTPHYDEASHNLEWGTLLHASDGNSSVNYNVRLLGRRGIMEAALVADPEQMGAALPELRNVLTRFAFNQGEDYASFRAGDKVAEYGLAALVTGGAVAVAAKSGLLARFGKFILIGLVAIGAAVKRLFSRSGSNS
ncbi:MAG: DUF2167 domain-containing protein [Myxococcaceae bacterium]